MSALTAVQPIVSQGSLLDRAQRPVLAGVRIYKGGIVGVTSAGYARPFAIGDNFGGHAKDTVDNVSGGNGAVDVDTTRGSYTLTLPVFDSAVLADIGDDVGAASDNHADLTKKSTDKVGVISTITDNGVQVTFKTFEA